jgi:hypothetical protein
MNTVFPFMSILSPSPCIFKELPVALMARPAPSGAKEYATHTDAKRVMSLSMVPQEGIARFSS